MNEKNELIACWHKLEHFSLPAVQIGKETVELIGEEPWKDLSVVPAKGKTFEYTVYLGVFEVREAVEFVREFFKDTTEEVNRATGYVCVASLKTDIRGQYLANSLGISTLTWAFAQLEQGRITDSEWADEFRELEEGLENECSVILAKELSATSLRTLQKMIVEAIGWSRKPDLKIYCKREEKMIPREGKVPESNADILNSFFIRDLEDIVHQSIAGKLPAAFEKYVQGCLNHSSKRVDLNTEVAVLKETMRPMTYPDGCWPSAYTLSLMQQFAVNTVFHRLSEEKQGDVLSVNGPPGTGKTTLLRDIIAANLVARAKAMLRFSQPGDAFTKIGQLEMDGGFSPFIYQPDESLCQWGMVVASSNNGAVENISKELPLKKETGDYAGEIGYFRRVAEDCMDPEYWGIVAAVLGNRENRNKLVTALWFGGDEGKQNLRQFLSEDTVGGTDWRQVTQEFQHTLWAVEEEKKRLEQIRENAERQQWLATAYREALRECHEVEELWDKIDRDYWKAEDDYKQAVRETEVLWQNIERVRSTKPGFFRYWLSGKARKNYKQVYGKAYQAYLTAQENLLETQGKKEKRKGERTVLLSRLEEARQKREKTEAAWNACETLLAEARSELGSNFAGGDYWKNTDAEETQKSCPWYSPRLKELQSRLFIKAMEVHEAFILYANSRSCLFRTSLSGFFSFLKGDYKKMPSAKELKAMWDTFFLVVPVVSTTFASVQTLFHGLDRASLSWLFIDEAGQAVPQAAAGAIWRSRKVVVVGDPLQIEPVVTVPYPIIDNISQYFNLGSEQINSGLSVQSMADRVNPLGMYLNQETGPVWVGIPLRVHRRCLNPMFSISNQIAYDGKMVLATGNPKKINVQFENRFIHCPGSVEGKHWVPQQGELVKEILVNEIHANRGLPDVFVISPFSEVSFRLKGALSASLLAAARKYIPGLSAENMWVWLKEHIGTVHTFQGKQAEGVILCLGLDEKSKGAARWASSKPNLLNVAVTRAKYRFVAIGDRNIWLNVPYFRELGRME